MHHAHRFFNFLFRMQFNLIDILAGSFFVGCMIHEYYLLGTFLFAIGILASGIGATLYLDHEYKENLRLLEEARKELQEEIERIKALAESRQMIDKIVKVASQ